MNARNAQRDLVDAKMAAELLGIKRQTLYAYVSRGLIRTCPSPTAGSKMYMRQDLEQLQLNGRAGRGRQVGLTRNGATLPTSITSIDEQGPSYRGKAAIDLAKMRRPFEDCVELLWTGVLPSRSIEWAPPFVPRTFGSVVKAFSNTEDPPSTRQVLAVITAAYAARMGRSPETSLGGSQLAARQLLQVLAASVGLICKQSPDKCFDIGKTSIAALIARGTSISSAQDCIDAINACLILSADHELAPSTYAARVAASGGADIFACVTSGFGTFEGPLNGLGCDEPEFLLRSATSANHYVSLLKERMKRKEPPIGYNHPSYPGGDPRARYLIELSKNVAKLSGASKIKLECMQAAETEFGLKPSLALGLVMMAAALRMPPEMPGVIMAIGRASGWIAHVFEQRTVGDIARPRTRYIGPQVEISSS